MSLNPAALIDCPACSGCGEFNVTPAGYCAPSPFDYSAPCVDCHGTGSVPADELEEVA